jgi:[ribosomal protein S5]-alanine N-acetyltransferase
MMRLKTERLVLRPFRRSDADEFARLSGDWAVASMTSDIPYPFSPAQALGWLKPVRGEERFGIELDGQLIGGVGFYRRPSGVAELGFWLGQPWWGHGYATEAGRAVVNHGFSDPRLPAFSSAHFLDNRASAGVLAKLGFEPTGHALIACAARQCEVEVVTYWLDRKRARAGEPVARARHPSGHLARWRAWLGMLGGA